MELYSSCSGDWETHVNENEVTAEERDAFLCYAATFLSNVGNLLRECTLAEVHAAYLCNLGIWRSEIRPTT